MKRVGSCSRYFKNSKRWQRPGQFRLVLAALFLLLFWCQPLQGRAAPGAWETKKAETQPASPDSGIVREQYRAYEERLEGIRQREDIEACGFQVIEDQVFPVTLENFGEVTFLPALDETCRRLVLFFAQEDGEVVYKTEELASNYVDRGTLKQRNRTLSAVSFQDVDQDGLTDIVLIASCAREGLRQMGEVLFAKKDGFYRDWRVSDKINRYGMNKSVDLIVAYARDRKSTEFLYTAATWEELENNGFTVIAEQCYPREFEKLGKLWVVPGKFCIADYELFLVYLINEQGYIVWSFQPMGEYDSLYALKGINCRDIDGDGMKDIMVLARYSRPGQDGETAVESDYAVYYQRTGGFSQDVEIKEQLPCQESDTMEELVKKARLYWGWKAEE